MMTKRRILVLGGGVNGLTVAHELLARNMDVTLIAEKWHEDTVSVVAGALWEWPPAVCGFHSDIESLERSKSWSELSYHKFVEMSEIEDSGITLTDCCFYFRHPIAESEFDRTKMEEISKVVSQFTHDPNLIRANDVNQDLGLVDSYQYAAPIVWSRKYLDWLKHQLINSGAAFVNDHVVGPLSPEKTIELCQRFDTEAIVNCSGLGAKDLGDDSVYPLRGALIQMDWKKGCEMQSSAHCITNDEKRQQNMIYMVPRGDGLLLGGIAEPDQWDLSETFENSSLVRDIKKRCFEFMPNLPKLVDEEQQTISGLRPARKSNVRLQQDPDVSCLIHNYGHGGSGFSFSWGCAKDVAEMLA